MTTKNEGEPVDKDKVLSAEMSASQELRRAKPAEIRAAGFTLTRSGYVFFPDGTTVNRENLLYNPRTKKFTITSFIT